MATSNRRERELARRRLERQAQRRAEARARARQRNAIVAGVVAALLVAGAVAFIAVFNRNADVSTTATAGTASPTLSTSAQPSAEGSPSAGASPSASTSPAAFDGTCNYPDAGTAARNVGKPPTVPPLTKGTSVDTITTNLGDITLGLNATKAPCTVNSFNYLAKTNYYANTQCHRLTTEGIFVLQCGDPTGTGSGGPGYSFADENLTGATYPAGTVAMANAGPGTNGSQFFLVYRDSKLPPKYTPFGVIRGGLDIVQRVAAAGAEPAGDGKPVEAVTIKNIRVGDTLPTEPTLPPAASASAAG